MKIALTGLMPPDTSPGMALNNEVSSLESPVDGLHLFLQKWTPDGKPNRLIVFQHGFGEHSGRYGNLIEALDDGKTAFYAIDARGHGRSAGQRGHADDFHYFGRDLGALVDKAQADLPGIPTILFGHSLGGAIALDYVIESQAEAKLKALAVSAPALAVVMDPVKHVKKTLGTVLASVLPSASVDAGLDVKYLSHDQAVIEKYQDDPLVHGKVSFIMGRTLFEVGKGILAKAAGIKLPVYIFHGAADNIVSPTGSQQLYERLTTPDKTIKLFNDTYHEGLNETEDRRQPIIQALKEWIDNHSK